MRHYKYQVAGIEQDGVYNSLYAVLDISNYYRKKGYRITVLIYNDDELIGDALFDNYNDKQAVFAQVQEKYGLYHL